jgi:hypothetical protein
VPKRHADELGMTTENVLDVLDAEAEQEERDGR